MARKRQRIRRDARSVTDGLNQGHHFQPDVATVDGKVVNIRQISPTDEGVLYTMQISHRKPIQKSSTFFKLRTLFSRMARKMHSNVTDGPMSDTLWSARTMNPTQFTIAKKKKFTNPILNWIDSLDLVFWNTYHFSRDVDSHLYRPSNLLYQYINWTFHADFASVFVSFLIMYFSYVLMFAGLIFAAGVAHPVCIRSSGDYFGANPLTKFHDAFAMSWTTFTTLGYGMSYPSTNLELVDADGSTHPNECSLIVLLCNIEAFMGMVYAGMCGAILFGKVNRVQSHAKLRFANAVCLQYEEIDSIEDVADDTDGEEDFNSAPEQLYYELSATAALDGENEVVGQFIDQYNGCPVIKFQVVNEMCNQEGNEIVDAIMKVVGVKFKGRNGKITHSQYVRVHLVDFEHPFFSRVWHGVHILDAASPLLTEKAKQKIKENKGSWPAEWFNPLIIKEKLDFNDLIVSVLGISNVSAVTVHAYKRYKIGDVLIGFNFAPIVFRDDKSGKLEVDMSMCHDVIEQRGGGGEDLMNVHNRIERANSSIKVTVSECALEESMVIHNPYDTSVSENGKVESRL